MRRSVLERLRGWLPVLVLLLACTVPGWAQDSDAPIWREPGIRFIEATRPWIQWCLGMLFVAGVAFVAFKNPHRSHLD